MPSWRVTAWLLIAWTLAMAIWFVEYRETAATCGPEIYRNCQIGLKVDGGTGRPGILVLWALGAVALGMTWLTTSGSGRNSSEEKPAKRPLPPPLLGAAKLSAVVIPVAIVVGFAASPTLREPKPERTDGVRIQVLSADLLRAATPSGRRRNRARLTVHVRITNQGARVITNIDPVLIARARVRPDPRTRNTTGSLLRPVPPGFTAGGTLRFETGGASTARLATTLRAQLRIAGATTSFRAKIMVRKRRSPPATISFERAG